MEISQARAAVSFYDTHPINNDEILAKLRAAGKNVQALTVDGHHRVPLGRCEPSDGASRTWRFSCKATPPPCRSDPAHSTPSCRRKASAIFLTRPTCWPSVRAEILVRRLQMYRSLRDTTIAKFAGKRYEEYDSAYAHFVSLFVDGRLGGRRMVASRE